MSQRNPDRRLPEGDNGRFGSKATPTSTGRDGKTGSSAGRIAPKGVAGRRPRRDIGEKVDTHYAGPTHKKPKNHDAICRCKACRKAGSADTRTTKASKAQPKKKGWFS